MSAPDELKFPCPECGRMVKVGGNYAGRQIQCPWCQRPVQAPLSSSAIAPTPGEAPPQPAGTPGQNPFALEQQEMEQFRDWKARQAAGQTGEGEGGGNPAVGWIIFILIFGVGNLILYATTGIFFIPIPRR
jgi:hypothetical protein